MLKFVLGAAVITCNVTVVKSQNQDSLLLNNTLTSEKTVSVDTIPANWRMSAKHRQTTQFVKSLYVSVPLIAMGVMGTTSTAIINKYEIKEERDEHFPDFRTKIDNYLIFAPIAAVYTMNALGIKGEHPIGKQTVLLLKSELIMNAIVFPLKTWTHVKRPNGQDNLSFPSGHTAQAFLAAEFLRKEYGKTHPWLAVGGFAAATSVAAFRMMNDKHWAPDVLAGAGIGLLSVNLAYLTQKIKMPLAGKNVQIMPTYTGAGPGLYMCYHLGK